MVAPNVRVVANDASPTVSDSTGQFSLTFPTLRPGDPIKVKIVREGWAVVNDVELDRELPVNPDARRLVIVISKAQERQVWALRYYRLRGEEVVDAEYQRRLKERQGAQAVGSKEREQLRSERDQARAQVDELARQLAEDRAAEAGTDVRKAQQFFLDGRIDDALQLMSEARLKQQATQAEKALKQVAQGYILRGQLLAAKFQFNDASNAYAEAVRLAPDDPDVQFQYGAFNQRLNRFKPARESYEKALWIFRDLAKINPEPYRPKVAITLNNLGGLYYSQAHYDDAKAAYEEALAIRRELVKVNLATYRPDLAISLENLGNVYDELHRYSDAIEAYNEALAIWSDLSKTNFELHRSDVAEVLGNVGVLYRNQGRYGDARAAEEKSLLIYRDLSKMQPELYRPYLATMLHNLGDLLLAQNRKSEALEALSEALAIRRDLAKTNPEAYLPNLAYTLNNLGNLYRSWNRYGEAKVAYEEAFAIYSRLAVANPERFRPAAVRLQQTISALPLN
jgi:tetratricopeptide (TPR) repeat protein